MPIFETLALAGFWALLRAMTPEKIAVMDPGLVAACRAGEAVTQEQLVEALGKRAVLGAAVRQFFDRYDLLLSPTMPIPAAYAEPRDDDLPDPNNYRDWMPYTWPFNLTRNPSASIPCGFADGLPLGLMVTGPLYDDLGVLQACRAYEEAAGAAWPSAALTAALAKAEGPADRRVDSQNPAAARIVINPRYRLMLRRMRRSESRKPMKGLDGSFLGCRGADRSPLRPRPRRRCK